MYSQNGLQTHLLWPCQGDSYSAINKSNAQTEFAEHEHMTASQSVHAHACRPKHTQTHQTTRPTNNLRWHFFILYNFFEMEKNISGSKATENVSTSVLLSKETSTSKGFFFVPDIRLYYYNHKCIKRIVS